MKNSYVNAKDFGDFKKNQNKLIDILNHNMTQMSTDVNWIKSWMKWAMGIFASLFITLITVILTKL